MNLDLFEGDVPTCLLALAEEVEGYCNFEIRIEHDPFLPARGMLSHSSKSITIFIKQVPAQAAVVAHELCHARRHFNRKVWTVELIHDRKLPGTNRSAAHDLDNQIEHLVVYGDMLEECGFSPDDRHVVEDLAAVPSMNDAFHRRATLLLSWLLINKYFRWHLPGVQALLEQAHLTQVADTLSAEVGAAGDSKARIVAAVAKALEIPAEEIRLRRHTTKENGDDEGDMLARILADEEKG